MIMGNLTKLLRGCLWNLTVNQNVMKTFSFFVLAAIAFLTSSCKHNQGDNMLPVKLKHQLGEITIADSIIYDVIIRDINGEDPWEAKRLSTFKHEQFVNLIFDQLYRGSYTAYNFETQTKISVDEIKAIENTPGFSRQLISKVQFNEGWYADSLGQINKRINSMILGVESYSKQGTFLGYQALFIVKPEPCAQSHP